MTIQWTAANVDSGSISLAYDATTNWGNPQWIETARVTAATAQLRIVGTPRPGCGSLLLGRLFCRIHDERSRFTRPSVRRLRSCPLSPFRGPRVTFRAGQSVTIDGRRRMSTSRDRARSPWATTRIAPSWDSNQRWIEIGGSPRPTARERTSGTPPGWLAGTYYLGGYILIPWDVRQILPPHLNRYHDTSRPDLSAHRPDLGRFTARADVTIQWTTAIVDVGTASPGVRQPRLGSYPSLSRSAKSLRPMAGIL